MDVNHAMLTAGWNQMVVTVKLKYNMDILHRM
jgi:hypothetical protein